MKRVLVLGSTGSIGTQTLDAVTLHKEVLVGNGKSQTVEYVGAVGSTGSETQQATFTDEEPNAFFHSSNPLGGVIVAGHGVDVTVLTQNTGGTMTVSVDNPVE